MIERELGRLEDFIEVLALRKINAREGTTRSHRGQKGDSKSPFVPAPRIPEAGRGLFRARLQREATYQHEKQGYKKMARMVAGSFPHRFRQHVGCGMPRCWWPSAIRQR